MCLFGGTADDFHGRQISRDPAASQHHSGEVDALES